MIDEETLYEETMARAKARLAKLRQEWQTKYGQNLLKKVLVALQSGQPVKEVVKAEPFDYYWSGQMLNGIPLSKMDLRKANFREVKLSEADFRGSNLEDADFQNSPNLGDANFEGANLTRANFKGVLLWGSNLSNANLTQAQLVNADLSSCNLENANFTGANLSGANLMGARLNGAIFDDAILQGTRFGNYAEGTELGLSQSALEAIAQLNNIKERIGEPSENM